MRNCCSRGNGRDYRRSRDIRSERYDRFGRSGRIRGEGIVTGGFYWLAGWPALVIYLACALLLRPEPADIPTATPTTATAGERPAVHLEQTARDVRDRTRDLEARIGRLESHVTSKEYDFDRRLGADGRGDR
jgi:phage shock protein C